MEKVILFMEDVLIFAKFYTYLIFTECTKNGDFTRKCPLFWSLDTKMEVNLDVCWRHSEKSVVNCQGPNWLLLSIRVTHRYVIICQSTINLTFCEWWFPLVMPMISVGCPHCTCSTSYWIVISVSTTVKRNIFALT